MEYRTNIRETLGTNNSEIPLQNLIFSFFFYLHSFSNFRIFENTSNLEKMIHFGGITECLPMEMRGYFVTFSDFPWSEEYRRVLFSISRVCQVMNFDILQFLGNPSKFELCTWITQWDFDVFPSFCWKKNFEISSDIPRIFARANSPK